MSLNSSSSSSDITNKSDHFEAEMSSVTKSDVTVYMLNDAGFDVENSSTVCDSGSSYFPTNINRCQQDTLPCVGQAQRILLASQNRDIHLDSRVIVIWNFGYLFSCPGFLNILKLVSNV